MVKDYFQDITPPDDAGTAPPPPKQPAPPPPAAPDRGIRSVNIPSRGRAPMGDMRAPGASAPRPSLPPPPPRRNRGGKIWLWIFCGVCVLAVLLLLFLFVFRTTKISIVPESQPVTFDATSQFTAYPAESAASGTIPYTVQSTDFSESQSVPSSGMQNVQTKASGSIVVVNDYSTSPVKLIANTRFQSASGLIFRVPAAVSIPGKTSAGPGKVSVTVAADQAGQQYNIGPQSKFTIPGLQSAGAEYTEVYAYSTASTTGGFSGEQPAVSQSDLAAATSKMQADLQDKANAFESSQNSDTQTALGMNVSFAQQPPVPGASGSVTVTETAHADVALVPSSALASAVGQTVAANVGQDSVKLVPGQGFGITLAPGASFGTDPLNFTLAGQGQLVWVIDTDHLAQALAGRPSSAFQTIVGTMPGIQSASAKIEPFWEQSFPSNPSDIHITVQSPASGNASASQ